ncbi:hypothetical protein HZC21_04570 [Candidatus Peregrinibacteria bacterium]|nr:hypothetical protein [Candidatus Peregrinibacteria bacterium]
MSLQKICEVGNHTFTLSDADIEAYKKFGFEPLNICFPHQHQWRLNFRNDRFLYRRKCDLTGENIISMYQPSAQFPVYSREVWFSDRFDPIEYGRSFDFSKPFFEQFAELKKVTPHMALGNVGSINSEYCNMCVYNKNCYLIFGGDRNEDSMYGSLPMYCRNCYDCDWTTQSELCYFSAYSEHCYSSRFIFNCKNCYDCGFCENLIGCNNCILSFNLRNKSYYIENKPYTKEEFEKLKRQFIDGSFLTQRKLWEYFLKLRASRAVKYANILNCENCSGDMIFNSKNCRNCFECIGNEDCRDCYTIFKSKDCFNSDYVGHKCVLSYNNIACDTAYRAWNSWWTIESSDIDYSIASNYSKNLFGCIGAKHNEYCIFNKQYSKEDFSALKEKIIAHMKRTGEWGRFFPKSISPFPYNESTSNYFFPLKKEEALAAGFRWRDPEIAANAQVYKIPDNINSTPDSIANEILVCKSSKRNFRILPQEFSFYKSQNIPIPREHPDARFYKRLALRNPFKLFERKCAKCAISLKTTYAPERTETIYCEKCYLQKLY